MSLLAVEDVSRHYGGVRALDGVSLQVRQGEIVGIIGPNGSGKTTLVNCVTGFVAPTGGRVRFQGVDITGRSPRRIARLGLVRTFQVPRPFAALTATENLVVALSSARAARSHGDRHAHALDLLEDLGFERTSAIPNQLAGTLPTGLLKRLEVARCLAQRPVLILLDEVFSGLSAGETASLVPMLARLRERGTTLVMVEHRLRELRALADRLIALSEGRVVAQGSPSAVLDDPAVRSAWLGEDA